MNFFVPGGSWPTEICKDIPRLKYTQFTILDKRNVFNKRKNDQGPVSKVTLAIDDITDVSYDFRLKYIVSIDINISDPLCE